MDIVNGKGKPLTATKLELSPKILILSLLPKSNLWIIKTKLESTENSKALITQANLAPSGETVSLIGSMMRSGVLTIYFMIKSGVLSLLDYKGTGSLIAFGDALEKS